MSFLVSFIKYDYMTEFLAEFLLGIYYESMVTWQNTGKFDVKILLNTVKNYDFRLCCLLVC